MRSDTRSAKHRRFSIPRWLILITALSAILLLTLASRAADSQTSRSLTIEEMQTTRQKAQKDQQDGNYKDALESFQKLALSTGEPRMAGEDLNQALNCLQQLNRVDEADAFREKVIEVHKNNWRLLSTAAQTYLNYAHEGYMISGEFQRGPHRGGGRYVSASERDRIRALQLMLQGHQIIEAANEPKANDVGEFYRTLATMLLSGRNGSRDAWRLQYLTDLTKLPDYEEGYQYFGGGETKGAPVDADGNPIFHHMPASWDAALTDGERWRWALDEAMRRYPDTNVQVPFEYASFLRDQFGVQTMQQNGFWPAEEDDTSKTLAGPYAVHTLNDHETIARLANGIKRFDLPDEFNYIAIFQRVADMGNSYWTIQANQALGNIYENRRQYDRAAPFWQRVIDATQPDDPNHKNAETHLEQITGNWGRFENSQTQPADARASVDFVFRNGRRIDLEAYEINVKQLLTDVKEFIKSRPNRLDWDKIEINDIGRRLIAADESKYIGKKVADWSMDLDPRLKHFARRIAIQTPLQRAGAYFVVAKMQNGNTSRIVLWVADTVIIKKPLQGTSLYFVADARTGKPVAKANVEFFGYRMRNLGRNQIQIDTHDSAEFTDANGQVNFDQRNQENDREWNYLAIATTGDGRLAYLGLSRVWTYGSYDSQYEASKAFLITDRPVYRPGQPVKFKVWVRHAKYDQTDTSDFAGQSFRMEINNPKGDKVLEKSFTADSYGGFDGEYALPADATLGAYGISVMSTSKSDHYGGGSFRVEEYKKPEFEVTVDAPKEPVMLGEKIPATVTAKYYFGAPVKEAKVKVKVLRSERRAQWYPLSRWDWFYGPGYWWFGYDYFWYPGWERWGCPRPIFDWWPRNVAQPELVLENELPIGADGTVKIEIDTAIAKEIHGDQDHQYEITAEVTDQSRRTIVGKGTVMAAREPFKVYAWVDRGHYNVGDTIQAEFQARTLDDKPVPGKGVLSLLRISYDKDMNPSEESVQQWNLNTDAEGRASQQMKASQAGQYRLSYKATDVKGHTIEGGYVFVVTGEGFDSSKYRFNDIELVTDKKEYKPGDKVRLLINTNRKGSTVLLFVRPSNGIYLPPKTLYLKGKSTKEEIEVSMKDMPNFFVEAVTIHDGQIFTDVREVVVPPEQRVLNLKVTPDKTEYKPGEKATVKVQLTDLDGKPFVGSTVLTVYDKSLEYISGGSNVPEIREFFWKWRRSHRPMAESSLNRPSYNLLKKEEKTLGPIGVFGYLDSIEEQAQERRLGDYSYYAGRQESALYGGYEMRSTAGGMAMDMAAPAAAPMSEMAPGAVGLMKGTTVVSRRMDISELKQIAIGDTERIGGAPGGEVQPMIRSKFADAALWVASLDTDSSGTAQVDLTMPENLTDWKIRSWAMGHGTKVAQAEADVVTKKNLLLRLQAPRFFVEKDEVVLSANIHNYLKTDKKVRVVLELEGGTLEATTNTEQSANVKADGEIRIDWRVKAVKEGEAVVRMKALTDEESDAMEMRFPVHVHGMDKMVAFSGYIRPDKNSATITLDVPKDRRPETARLEVRYSPTLAGAMVDALPYLVGYPYGCTEQTLNRFLPTVITQKILINMGIDLKAVRDKRTNLNAQELGDPQERAEQWKRFKNPDGTYQNPVFDPDKVNSLVKEGVEALTQMQLSDGGWGWFSGYSEQSTPHMTAMVVHGLWLAQQNGVAIAPDTLSRGTQWLQQYQNEEIQKLKNYPGGKPNKQYADNMDALVLMVLTEMSNPNSEMRDFLYRDRNQLAVYAKAMLGMSLHREGLTQQRDMVIQNIEQYLVRDDENQTAYLKLGNEGCWWFWYGSEYEAHAYYLKLLSLTGRTTDWKAPYLVKYLLNNRKHATYWNSTRDTAICIEAFADYLKASKEDKPNLTVEVFVDGKKQKEVQITPQNLFTFDNTFVLEGDKVATGEHKVELRKKGTGPLYFNAYLSYFSLEDFIKKAGLEIKVDRKVYKLVEVDKTIKAAGSRGQAVDQKVEKYERQLLENEATLKSGGLVEIELTIESKNDYEYLVFEDMKAAGFEPVEVQSGYNGNDMGAYVEYRDNRVAFFVQALARGKHSVSYRTRAEIPGRYSALPAKGYAMYAPELRANSDEIKLKIED